jgi:hypothetical protein
MADVTYYVGLPFVVSYDGSARSGVITIGDFAARRIDLDYPDWSIYVSLAHLILFVACPFLIWV